MPFTIMSQRPGKSHYAFVKHLSVILNRQNARVCALLVLNTISGKSAVDHVQLPSPVLTGLAAVDRQSTLPISVETPEIIDAGWSVDICDTVRGSRRGVMASIDQKASQINAANSANLVSARPAAAATKPNLIGDARNGGLSLPHSVYLTTTSVEGDAIHSSQSDKIGKKEQYLFKILGENHSSLYNISLIVSKAASVVPTGTTLVDAGRLLIVNNPVSAFSTAGVTSASDVDGKLPLGISDHLVKFSRAPSIVPVAGWSLTDTEPLQGSGNPNSLLALFDKTSSGISLLGIVSVNAAGAWKTSGIGHFVEGANNVYAAELGFNPPGFPYSAPQQIEYVSSLPRAPSLLTQTVAALSMDNVETLTGKGDSGSTIQFAEQTTSGYEVFDEAEVGADGTWSISVPQLSLGFGHDAIYARATNVADKSTPWTHLTYVDVQDPETGAVHVGADLRQALIRDAAYGLDATADLQKLASEASGTTDTVLDVPAGTYIVSSTIFLKSQTILDAPGVTIKAASNWHLSTSPIENSTIRYAMIANSDWSSPSPVDQGIEIRNVSFNWDGINSPGSAAVRFVNARNVFVDSASFNGSEDGTAFEGVEGGVVENSTAVNTTNYGFDNWGGPQDTVIKNNSVYAASFGGIAITGELTDNAVTPGSNNVVIGNAVSGFSSYGIDIDTLDAASTLTNVLVYGNATNGPGRGIEIVGSVTNATVANNSVKGTFGPSAIYVAGLDGVPGAQAAPANVRVSENRIAAAYTAGPYLATIRLQASGGAATFNTIDNTSAPAGVWLFGTSLLAAGNTGVGSPTATQTNLFGSSTTTVEQVADPSSLSTGQTPVRAASNPVNLSGVDQGYGSVGQADVAVTDFSAPLLGDLPDQLSAIFLSKDESNVSFIDGDHTIYLEQSAADATIKGGLGDTQVVLLGGSSPDFDMGSGMSDITALKVLDSYPPILTIELNAMPGLQVWTGDSPKTVTAGGPNQVIHPGIGADTLIGFLGGGTELSGTTHTLGGDFIKNFDQTSIIDLTDMLPSAYYQVSPVDAQSSVLYASDGFVSATIKIAGSFTTNNFSERSDSGHGVIFSLHH